jgi:acetyl esterase/lipase
VPGAGRVEWYDSLMYPNQADTASPETSPLLAPLSQLQHAPDIWAAVADIDILHGEGIAFSKKSQNAGVKTTVKEYAKTPHTLLLVGKLPGLPVIGDVVEVVRTG